ncbi:MAG: hypothetical protein LBC99_07205 [Spirochaetota bacterium]|jgi:ABC-type glycerol-3-phosphate transport system permease component|nr:hypothetical protein [Spirochaetota bacterium]
MTTSLVLRSIFRLLGILLLEVIFLLVLLYILSPEEDLRALWELLRSQGFTDRLARAFGVCLLIGAAAVIAGMPLGFGIADLRRGRRLVLLMLLLFALLPQALCQAIAAFGIIIPGALLLLLAAASWIMILSALGAQVFPGTILASAELCGAPRLAIFVRILLPVFLPFCLTVMPGSVLLLMLLEGTLFSLVMVIFEQENLLFAVFALLFPALPLFTILVYLFVHIRYFRSAMGL